MGDWQRNKAERTTSEKRKEADYERGKRDYSSGLWPEEDATFWYMDGYISLKKVMPK